MIKYLLCGAGALVSFAAVAAPEAARADQMVSGLRTALCMTVTSNKLQMNRCGLGDAQNWFTSAYGQQHYHNLCLDMDGPGSQARLVVAACANKTSQRWALGANGRFNNEGGWCADVQYENVNEGGAVIAYKCDGKNNQVWSRGPIMAASAASLPPAQAKTAMTAPVGAVIDISGKIISQDGNGIVAQGGGNIVAQGGGNIVAQGGGNIMKPDGGAIVAQGGGNFHQ